MPRDDLTNESPQTVRSITDPEYVRLYRAEQTMTRVRAAGVAFAVLQVYTFYLPYPDGVMVFAYSAVAFLAIGNTLVALLLRRSLTPRGLTKVAIGGLVLDFAAAMSFVFVYTFDTDTAIWAVIYLLPLCGAVRFQLRGAMAVTIAASITYTARELFGALQYNNEFFPASITFRMGVAFMIAYVAGSTARNLLAGQSEVRAANVELAEMNRSMRDFVAIASHDMRTPLSVIGGLSGVLVSSDDAISHDERKESLRAIHRNSQSLDRLVNDLLTMSSIEAGTVAVHRENIDVAGAVNEAIAQVSIGREIKVDVPPHLLAWVDPDHIRRILVNLLVNAANYGAPPVAVSARAVDEHVEIDVRDGGRGVPESFVPLLFERFTRLESSGDKHVDGSGLGLAIVKGLAQRNGGDVRYTANGSPGAQFTVVLTEGHAVNADAPSAK